jgi:hypothetical protein
MTRGRDPGTSPLDLAVNVIKSVPQMRGSAPESRRLCLSFPELSAGDGLTGGGIRCLEARLIRANIRLPAGVSVGIVY